MLHPEIEAALAREDGILADLDGCLIAGSSALPGAAELVRRAGDRLVVLSNNSTHTAKGMARRLRAMALEIDPSRIILAGMAAVAVAAERHPGGRVLVVGSAKVARASRKAGLRAVGDEGGEVDLVLLCRSTDAGLGLVQRMVDAAADGVPLIVANPDITHPGDGLRPVIETGALAEIVRLCTGTSRMEVIGKPQPALFERAMARLGRGAERVLMIGDNPATDGAGARRLGMRVLLLEAGAGPAGLPRREEAGRGVAAQ